jgi:hypothetical protein
VEEVRKQDRQSCRLHALFWIKTTPGYYFFEKELQILDIESGKHSTQKFLRMHALAIF